MTLRDLSFEFLPYCLRRRDDGSYEVVNVDLKPVAFRLNQFGIRGDAAGFTHFNGITEELAVRLSFRGDSDLERIYLFDPEQAPSSAGGTMQDYLRRLGLLASLQTEQID